MQDLFHVSNLCKRDAKKGSRGVETINPKGHEKKPKTSMGTKTSKISNESEKEGFNLTSVEVVVHGSSILSQGGKSRIKNAGDLRRSAETPGHSQIWSDHFWKLPVLDP